MTDTIAAWPTGWMYAGLFALGVVRGLAYYAAGAGVFRVAGGRPRELLLAARARVQRVGAWSVVLTYPVYGLAAAIQVSCGVARVPLGRFTAALAGVSSLWAALQTALGILVLQSLVSGAWPWVLGALVLAGLLRAVIVARRTPSQT